MLDIEFKRAETPMNSPRYAVASQPLAGKSVTILGGGPGLTMGIAAHLMKHPVICVNNSFMLMDRPTVVVALDRRWWGWYGNPINARGDVAVTSLRHEQPLPQGFNGFALSKERDIPYSPDKGTLCGLNSGHAAIHLAMHLGASTIYLAGFDMGFPNGRTHWHEGHKVPSSEANYTNRFRPALESLVYLAKEDHSVQIEAVTPTAANIPETPLEGALERLSNDHGTHGLDHAPA
jgi:hypothetical protein